MTNTAMFARERILFVGEQWELRPRCSRFERSEFVIEPDGDAAIARAGVEHFDLIAVEFKTPTARRLDTFRKFERWGIEAPVFLWTNDTQIPRSGQAPREAVEPKPPVFEFSNVRVDTESGFVTRGGTPIFVSARELKMLKYFIRRKDQDVSREELLTDVWGFDPQTRTRTIDVHLAWIRQKLEAQPRHPQHFLTIRGLGYRFSA